MTQATIGFVFDGSGVVAAEQGLQRVVSAADRVDQSTSRAEGSTGALARSLTATGSAGNATRVVLEQLDKVERQLGLTAGTTGAALDRQAAMLGSYANSAKAAQMAGLNMSRQFADIGVTLAAGAPAYLVLLQQLPQVADGMEMARTQGVGFGAMLRETFGIFGRFLPLLAGFAAAAGAIAAPFAIAAERINAANGSILDDLDLTEEQLQRVGNTSVTMGDVMTGVWRSTARELNQAFGPAFDQFSDIVGDAYVWVIERTVEWARGMVSTAAGVAIGIAFGFRALPRAIAEVMIDVANFARPGLQMLVDVSVEAFNRIRAGMNIIRGLRGEAPIPEISAPELARQVNQFRGAGAELRDAWTEGLGLGRRAGELATDAFGRRLVEDILGARDDRVRRLAGEAGADVGRDYAEGIERGTRERAERIRAVQGARPLETTTLVGPELIDELARFREELLRVEEIGRNAGYRIADAFGGVGQALDGVLQSMSTFSRSMVEIAMAERDQQISAGQAIRARGILQVQTIGDVAAASKAAFEQDSAAYQALATLERGYRAVQFALSVQAMVQDAREAAASIINAKAKMAADSSAGAAKIFSQVGIWGFAAVGAMLALLGSLGGGGSSGSVTLPTSNTGTGTVLGAPDEASQSIANSLQRAEEYQNRDLAFSSQQVAALRSIQAGIADLTTAIAREVGVGGALNTGGLNLGTSTSQGFLGIGNTTRTRTLADQGLILNGGTVADLMGGVGGQFFQTVENSKTRSGFLGIGGGTTTWLEETTSAINADLSRQLGLVVGRLRDGILTAASILGVTGAEATLDAFRIELGRVSFEGLSTAEINERLSAIFSAAGDQMAQAILPDLTRFQQAGEGLMETLQRLATEYQVIDQTLASLGMTFAAVGLASVEARSRLIELSGGLEQFTEQASFFAAEFLTESQRLAPVQAAVNAELTRLGIATDITREQFAALVMGLDVSTQSGAAMYAALMNLAPALDVVLDASEDLARSAAEAAARIMEQGRSLSIGLANAVGNSALALQMQREDTLAGLDPSLRGLQRVVWEAEDMAKRQTEAQNAVNAASQALTQTYEREANVLRSTADRFRGFSRSLGDFRRSLEGADSASGGYAAARSEFERVSALARLGNEDALGQLQGVSEAYLRESQGYHATSLDYLRDLGAVRQALQQAEDVAGRTATNAERQLEEITRMAGGVDQVGSAVQSVAEAINRLADAQSALSQVNAPAGREWGRNPMVNQLLALGTGYSGDFGSGGFQAFIEQQDEATKQLARTILRATGQDFRISNFATGAVFTSPETFSMGASGIGRMAEAGPEAIMPLTWGPDGLGVRATANDNAEMVAELRQMNERLAKLESAAVSTAVHTARTAAYTGRTADDLDQVVNGGTPIRTEAA